MLFNENGKEYIKKDSDHKPILHGHDLHPFLQHCIKSTHDYVEIITA